MRYFHESHCRLNFHVVNRCYFSDVLQHSNAKTWLDSWSWKQHVAIFGWRIGASSQEKKKVKLIDRAEDTVDNNTNAAGDMDTGSASDGYDSGVDDANDADSDIEERRVDSLINKYL